MRLRPAVCDVPAVLMEPVPVSSGPKMTPAKARNTIVKRAFSVTGKFYFRMADGSLIKPETAIKRGLIDHEAFEAAMKEEQEALKNVGK